MLGRHPIGIKLVYGRESTGSSDNEVPLLPNRQVGTELRRALVKGKLGGNRGMVRSYNRHGCEAGRVVQITCDQDVETKFLRRMRLANIKQMEQDTEPLYLLPENPASVRDRAN